MIIPGLATREFWECYQRLPFELQQAAQKSYRLWAVNPYHPSLHFKKVSPPNWSVRVSINCRAVGQFTTSHFLWMWIGTHAEYDRKF